MWSSRASVRQVDVLLLQLVAKTLQFVEGLAKARLPLLALGDVADDAHPPRRQSSFVACDDSNHVVEPPCAALRVVVAVLGMGEVERAFIETPVHLERVLGIRGVEVSDPEFSDSVLRLGRDAEHVSEAGIDRGCAMVVGAERLRYSEIGGFYRRRHPGLTGIRRVEGLLALGDIEVHAPIPAQVALTIDDRLAVRFHNDEVSVLVPIDILEHAERAALVGDGLELPADTERFIGRHEVERPLPDHVRRGVAEDFEYLRAGVGVYPLGVHLPYPPVGGFHHRAVALVAGDQIGLGLFRCRDVE